jgi:hypothetical protein
MGGGTGESDLLRLANVEAKKRNFDTWEEAFHGFKTGSLT